MVVLALVIYNSYRQNQKANSLLAKQKREIELRSNEINQSINYAKRIQGALLPPHSEIKSCFKESFILFAPKDIVSGDFYWFNESKHFYFIAVADCTGHGVPGSLMSMLGSQLLNDAVEYTQEPGEILKFLNQGVKKSLRQTADIDSTRDGMDLILCRFDKNFQSLSFAGANRPLFLVRMKELIEYKTTKSAIGGLTSYEQIFYQEEISIKSDDCIYLSTDGFADQFGGTKVEFPLIASKKIKSKILKEKLLEINQESMAAQKESLANFFITWKGQHEQTDDVLIVGVKIC
ncbi:MAG TPA: SpoIIE family protein phosphatase [Bacteroidia bacterium]|nr:SpoIIE family protein phosphatase [Bacteroidia bacterium]